MTVNMLEYVWLKSARSTSPEGSHLDSANDCRIPQKTSLRATEEGFLILHIDISLPQFVLIPFTILLLVWLKHSNMKHCITWILKSAIRFYLCNSRHAVHRVLEFDHLHVRLVGGWFGNIWTFVCVINWWSGEKK